MIAVVLILGVLIGGSLVYLILDTIEVTSITDDSENFEAEAIFDRQTGDTVISISGVLHGPPPEEGDVIALPDGARVTAVTIVGDTTPEPSRLHAVPG